jgi:enterobacterial common antigen flippase
MTTAVQTHPAPVNAGRRGTYGQIVKSSALIGGASLFNIAFGIVRTKAMALLLGPSGVGLFGLYNSIYDLTRSVAGLGINNSGVRQIAEAVGSENPQRISETVRTLRTTALCTGALGAFLLLAFCRPVSHLTFGDDQHAGWVALLALAVFFADVSAGQAALVQGMRRIADLAKMNVLGGFYGTVLSVPIIFYFGEKGVVPSLVVVAATSILTSWWYARKIIIERTAIAFKTLTRHAAELLRLGIVFMATGLMTMGVAYFVRIILVRQLDMEAAGYYQAAWGMGGLYFGFILQAMGADFYPRLTAVAHRNEECNRLVNEQVEVGLLLAGPGILGTLTFAPAIITIFYSQKFGPAVEILRWICLGMMIRVAAWPMGFILVAKGDGKLFFLTELVANSLQVALIWAGVAYFGLLGTGIAFFALYVFYCAGIYFVVRRRSGFRWSDANRQLAPLLVLVLGCVFISGYILPAAIAILVGLLATSLTSVFCLKSLCALVPEAKLPRPIRLVTRALRFPPSS